MYANDYNHLFYEKKSNILNPNPRGKSSGWLLLMIPLQVYLQKTFT